MRKTKQLLLVVFLFPLWIQAQEVITTAGDYQKATTGSLSWTIGEPITETYTNGFNFLTQGFNQSQLSATATFELPGLNYQILAFPNPTSDWLIIETDQIENLEYQLYSIKGNLIEQKPIKALKTPVDFSELVPATYLIKIMQNQIEIKQFKIVKQ